MKAGSAIVKRLLLAAGTLSLVAGCATTGPIPRPLSGLGKIASVDRRFQSYNVEMVEVTGGRFWAPYGGPPGEVYRMRPPVDLDNPRLRALARHLGPAYMRVSGTWANSTYLPAEGETVTAPPEGYNQVLTRKQWRDVVDFAKAVDAEIVTSFAVSPGTRDADGLWKPEQAQRLLDLTREAGGTIAAAEFYNEPNASMVGGLPKGYSAADYVRDFRIFDAWVRQAAPEITILGPGGVGEGALGDVPVNALKGAILSKDMLAPNPGRLDAFSYHFYGSVSQRCASVGRKTAQKDEALTSQWLDLTLRDHAFYAGLRDTYEPGDPLWITETAQAACGGSPWAASFLDTFRYVNQMGLLAQKGVAVVMHNTLAASDYSLIAEDTLRPRPNYWAAVLWRRTMGTTVLRPPASPTPELRLYAHCLEGRLGGVALAAINLGDQAQTMQLQGVATSWVLQAQPLDSETITVNGQEPGVDAAGGLTGLAGKRQIGSMRIPGKAIAFVAVPGANNAACLAGS